MKKLSIIICVLMSVLATYATDFPRVAEQVHAGYFPLATPEAAASICTDANDFTVVNITAKMLAEDVERVTGCRPSLNHQLPQKPAVVAGTLGKSRLIDDMVKRLKLDVSAIRGKWEAFMIQAAEHPKYHTPLLIIVGSDRRGTAFGLTSLSEAIGVSPWYWWADVTPRKKPALFIEPVTYVQKSPDVQYRGIFINDERFGGWARWAEQHFEKETGKVGPKTYQKVFELLLRLKANYLWPAMHPGTQAFNDNPENARLADDYAIVMGSSHCEQMLRNNEGEWKAVDEQARRERLRVGDGTSGMGEAPVYGDFNYITNRRRCRTTGRPVSNPMAGMKTPTPSACAASTTTPWKVPTPRLSRHLLSSLLSWRPRQLDMPIRPNKVTSPA